MGRGRGKGERKGEREWRLRGENVIQ